MMKKKLINRTVLASVVLVSVVACNGGSASSGSSNASVQEAPAGPVLYSRIHDNFAKQASLSRVSQPPRLGPDGFLTIAELGFELNPTAITVFKVGKFLYDGYDFLKPDAKFNQLMDGINTLQKEIDQINYKLEIAQNVFYSYVRSQAQQQVKNATTTYYGSSSGSGLLSISGNNGAFPIFESTLAEFSDDLNQIASSEAAMKVVQNKVNKEFGGKDWTAAMQNLSTANVPSQCGESCYMEVKPSNRVNAATLDLYLDLQGQLAAMLPYNLESNVQTPSVELFESYNQEIVSIYLANVSALQQAYMIEATTNALNYLSVANYANGNNGLKMPTQLGPLENGMDSVFYTYGGASLADEAKKYMLAQKNLALLFAARYNVLASTTMGSVVSDIPFDNFSWPDVPKTGNARIQDEMIAHPYKELLSRTLKTFEVDSFMGTPPVPQVYGESQIFYQFSGFGQYYQCGDAMYQGESLNELNCPPLYSKPINGVFDGRHFMVGLRTNTDFAYSNTLNLSACISGPYGVQGGVSAGGAVGIWCNLNQGATNIELASQDNAKWLNKSFSYKTGGLAKYTDLNLNFLDFESVRLDNFVGLSAAGGTMEHSFEDGENFSVPGVYAAYFDAGVASFSAAFLYNISTPYNYSGALYLTANGTRDFHNTYNVDTWNVSLTCSEGETLCVPYAGGLCVNGDFITLLQNNAIPNNLTLYALPQSCL